LKFDFTSLKDHLSMKSKLMNLGNYSVWVVEQQAVISLSQSNQNLTDLPLVVGFYFLVTDFRQVSSY